MSTPEPVVPRVGPRACYSPEEVEHLPVLWRGDVLVAGGGSAGSAAAVAAARSGADCLLVEAGGFLGGTGARVLDSFYGFYAPGSGSERVVGGIGWEVCDRLFARGVAFERPSSYGAGTAVTYEPEALKRVWEELVIGAGTGLLLQCSTVAPVTADGALSGAVIETRHGPCRVTAPVVVDATGDAELAWRAGAAMERPRSGGLLQPCTTTFRLGGVATERAGTGELHRLMDEASRSGGYRLPRTDGSIHRTPVDGILHTNLTRVAGVDATDPWALSAAEVEGRRQVEEYCRFLRERVPGYERSHLISTSTRIGVRESRRLVGRYVLTRDDVLHGREFPDGIARCGAPIEDHDEGGSTRWEYVGSGTSEPTGRTYSIPLGCLLPHELDGLLVAGRALSATHDAHASVRSMAQCMAMGEAAGTAAALARESDTALGALDRDELRARLRAAGAIL